MDLGRLEQFFGGAWNRWVFNCRHFILIVFLLWAVFAIGTIFELSPLSEREEILPADHSLMATRRTLEKEFTTGGNNAIKVHIYFGVKEFKEGTRAVWDTQNIGEVVLDPDADVQSLAAQEAILGLCKELRTQTMVADGQVDCWLERFDQHVREKYKTVDTEYPVYNPITGAVTLTSQDLYPTRVPLNPKDLNRELQEWIAAEDYAHQLAMDKVIIMKDGKLKFFELQVNSIGKQWDSYEHLNPVYEEWANYMKAWTDAAPTELKSAKFTAGITFTWIVTEREFVNSALWGVFFAFIFAFIVLTLVTTNMLLALWSIFSVAIVIVSVVAIMVLKGWELGVAESIAIVLLIGLSVDYVVHLAQEYQHSAATHRSSKTKQAYQNLGISIFSGTNTTFIAGIILLGGKLMLF